MDWLTWIVPLAALFPLIYLLKVFAVMKAILGLRFSPASIIGRPLVSLSAPMREILGVIEADLSEAGFNPNTVWHFIPHAGEAWTQDLIVCPHAELPVNLVIIPNPRPELCGEVLFSLGTHLADGSELVTTNQQRDEMLPMPGYLKEEVLQAADLKSLLVRHRERITAATSAGISALHLMMAEKLVKLTQRLQDTLDSLIVSKQLVIEPDGRYAFRVRPAWKLARNLLAKIRQRKKTDRRADHGYSLYQKIAGRLSPETVGDFEYGAYRRMIAVQSGRMGGMSKTILMVASLFAFALVLGWKLSVSGVIILLAVLIFHEGGHLFGMRIFGHRDTQLLFLPFFGGAAVAHDERILKPWQHLVILFLGPLPGLFIGLALWAWAPVANPLVGNLVWTLLFLNIFNLLPIMPLDGGQIMDTAFVSRFPSARVFFLGLSALGLLGVTWLVNGGTFLGVLGLFMLMRLPVEWKSARLLKKLRSSLQPG